MIRWVLFAILFFFILIVITPVKRSSVLIINANFSNVYQSLNNSRNWVKWQTELKNQALDVTFKNDSANALFEINGPAVKFTVKKSGLTGFDIIRKKVSGHGENEYNYTLIADSAVLKTDVYVIQKTNLFGYVKSFLVDDKYKDTPVKDLKAYMEDPQLYYGYKITEHIAPEKTLIIKRTTVLKNMVCKNNQDFLTSLYSIALKNNLAVTDAMHLQYISSVGDSVTVMMGLPVNRKILIKGDAENMGMPGGKELVGYFKGKYSDRKKLYRAMQLYIADRFIQTQTLPLEKFNHNKLPDNDDAIVDMQVVIPHL
jgi:hypothetical protein